MAQEWGFSCEQIGNSRLQALYLWNCPRIIFAFDHIFQNSKIQLKNEPLKSKNQKSLKSQNVRKQTLPKYAHWFKKKLLDFSKLKNQTKKLPLKIQKPKITLKSQFFLKQTPPNIPTDSKSTLGIFKTQKSNKKITP